jgi:hypothetical protein
LLVQAKFPALSRFLFNERDLLKSGMEITAYNHHARLLLLELDGRFAATSLLIEGTDAVMQS